MAAYRYPGCASIAVKGLALATIESTGRVWDSNDMPTVTPSVDTHDMLTRIEYELVGDELHRTLGALVTRVPHLTFFDLVATPALHTGNGCCSTTAYRLLDYHAKTRTLVQRTHPQALPESVYSQSRPVAAHDVTFSPLSADPPLGFDTRTVRRIETILEELRRVEVRVSRLSGTILASVPSNGYVYDAQHPGVTWDEVRKLGWDIVWECIRHGQGFIRIDNLPTPVTVGQSDVLGGGEFEELLHLVRDDSSTVGLVLEIAGTVVKTSITLTQENLGVNLSYVLVDRWMGVTDTSRSRRGALEVHLPPTIHSPRTSTDETVDLAHTVTSLPTTPPATSFSML
ncbi:hypothetical protein EDD15DRAFT_2197070 [Pisolithus albus]|nr:hypothetical protein EDD15DRAFT_2197070 [Pisolithus albus]